MLVFLTSLSRMIRTKPAYYLLNQGAGTTSAAEVLANNIQSRDGIYWYHMMGYFKPTLID